MNNSTSCSPATPVCELSIRGLGHVMNFKNSKTVFTPKAKKNAPRCAKCGQTPPREGPKAFLITDPRIQKFMEKVITSFESQLLSLCQKTEGGTSTAQLARYLTRSLPPDDAWQFVPDLSVSVQIVPSGKEGAQVKVCRFEGKIPVNWDPWGEAAK